MNSEGISRPRVLFVYPTDATFVRRDQELLATFCDVRPFPFRGKNDYPALVEGVLRSDIVFSWFALGFSAVANAVARISGRKAVLVAGGWDVTGMPEITYGRLLTGRGRGVATVALSTAHVVLAFSDFSRALVTSIAPRANVRTLYLGVDTKLFYPRKKERIVVCISNITRENLLRKGLKTYISASKRIPDARFFLVGDALDGSVDELRAIGSPNVTFTGRLPERDLQELLGHAKVYAQPSYTEGFGVAIAEAMASGCVPVVTRSGAIPEVVGNAGLYVSYGDTEGLVKAIQIALESNLGTVARTRVDQLLRSDFRAAELKKLLSQMYRVKRRLGGA